MNRLLQTLTRTSSLLMQNTKHVLETPKFMNPVLCQNLLGTTQIRTFKDKEILKLRCNSCYFKRIDNRMWVLCNQHPRHKQRQKIEDIRMTYIVSHSTNAGHYNKKHYQYPYQDL